VREKKDRERGDNIAEEKNRKEREKDHGEELFHQHLSEQINAEKVGQNLIRNGICPDPEEQRKRKEEKKFYPSVFLILCTISQGENFRMEESDHIMHITKS